MCRERVRTPDRRRSTLPEFVEVESYRRTVQPVVGRVVDRIDVADTRLLRRDTPADLVQAAVTGARIDDVRRHGKVLLVDLDSGHSMALSFGLRGWLSLDDRIAPASGHGPWRTRPPRADHVRLTVQVEGHRLDLEDLLRLATLEIDIDETRLGVDVMELDDRGLRRILERTGAAVKSVLMDQRRIAGIGNLIADEICWQGGIDPRLPASELSDEQVDRLWSALRRTRARVLDRGGSHHGELIDSDAREVGRRCPRCDVEMQRVRLGSRTTFLCPAHQR